LCPEKWLTPELTVPLCQWLLCVEVKASSCTAILFVKRCLFLELKEQFDEMLRTNKDAVKDAIDNLNTQTSQRTVNTN